jgi:ABC-type phosphate/phosphonate transport system substrate-binding protein
MMAANEDIRFVTYLSPSIPQPLFAALADHVQRALGHERVSLRVDSRASGPQKGGECSSFAEEADVAFMCAPSFMWLRDLQPPHAELLGALPVFDDERNQGKPVYFSDVVVRNDGPIHAFSELEGGSSAYNDACSLSDYYSLLNKLAEWGGGRELLRQRILLRIPPELHRSRPKRQGRRRCDRLQRFEDTIPRGAGPPQ